MANTRVSDLSAGGAFADTDLFYVVETAGVGGVQKTGAQLVEFIQDTMNATLVGGSNISVTYNDPSNTITIAYTGAPPPADTDDLPEGSTNLYFTDARAIAAVGPVREALTANATYYVNAATGSDSNDGLSSGSPFLTIQKAVDTVATFDGVGLYSGTIEVAAGTYAEVVLLRTLVGYTSVIINGAAAATTIITGGMIEGASSLQACFYAAAGVTGTYRIREFRMTPSTAVSNAWGIYLAEATCTVLVGRMIVDRCRRSAFEAFGAGSLIRINENDITDASTGAAAQFLFAQNQGRIVWNSTATTDLTISGTPTYTQWARCELGSIVQVTNFAFTVSGSVTGPRFFVRRCSVINTNSGGATYLPGSSAGTEETSTSGHYT